MLCAALLAATPAQMQGILFGKPISFDHVSFQKFSVKAKTNCNGVSDVADTYALTFQKGESAIYDQGIKFHLNVKTGAKLDQLSIVQPSVKFGTPEYTKVIHGHSAGASCGRGAMAAFVDGFGRNECASDLIKFKLFVKSAGNGMYRASIYGYNSEFKSGVQGNFTFRVEKI